MLKAMCQTATWAERPRSRSCHQAPPETPSTSVTVPWPGCRTRSCCGSSASLSTKADPAPPSDEIATQTAKLRMISVDRGQGRVARSARPPYGSRPVRVGPRPLLHAARALEPHRGGVHAVRADRPVAPLAADPGLAIRVPVADRGGRPGSVMTGRSLSPRVISTDSMTTGSTGRSRGPVGVVAIASTTSRLGLVGDLAEDRVLVVQPGASAPTVMKNCEPLVPGSGVGHREQVGLGEGELGVELVLEGVARPAGAGAQRAATLDHEARRSPGGRSGRRRTARSCRRRRGTPWCPRRGRRSSRRSRERGSGKRSSTMSPRLVCSVALRSDMWSPSRAGFHPRVRMRSGSILPWPPTAARDRDRRTVSGGPERTADGFAAGMFARTRGTQTVGGREGHHEHRRRRAPPGARSTRRPTEPRTAPPSWPTRSHRRSRPSGTGSRSTHLGRRPRSRRLAPPRSGRPGTPHARPPSGPRTLPNVPPRRSRRTCPSRPPSAGDAGCAPCCSWPRRSVWEPRPRSTPAGSWSANLTSRPHRRGRDRPPSSLRAVTEPDTATTTEDSAAAEESPESAPL